jgi:hypothetical protein
MAVKYGIGTNTTGCGCAEIMTEKAKEELE